MNKKRLLLLLFVISIILLSGAIYAQDGSTVANMLTVGEGTNAGMRKLATIQNRTQEIANGTLDWSVILFDTILTAVMTTIGSMPILNDPTSSRVIQTVMALAFTWEFMIIIRDLQKGEFDTKAFGALVLHIGFIMCLYGVHDYRNMIPGTQDLWEKADEASSGDDSVKTLDKDLFNIVKYFGSQVSAGFKPNGDDVFRIISLSQSESLIKKYCEKENYPNMKDCRDDVFRKYGNDGGALPAKGKEDVLKLVRERDYNTGLGGSLDMVDSLAYAWYSVTYISTFVELVRSIMSLFVTVVNIIGIILANVVMMGSLLEASMILIILKILYPFLLVRTQRQKVTNILRGWLGFALVGMVCTICSFICDIMMTTGMNILTGSTASATVNTIIIGVLMSPFSFGFFAVVKVLLISILALKISLIKKVGQISQGLMNLQLDGLANLGGGAMSAMMGVVAVGAGVVAGGFAGASIGKKMLGFGGGGGGGGSTPPITPGSNLHAGNGGPGEGGSYLSPAGANNAELDSKEEDSVDRVEVTNGQDVGKGEVKTNSQRTTSNPRNAFNLPQVDDNGKPIRNRGKDGRFTSQLVDVDDFVADEVTKSQNSTQPRISSFGGSGRGGFGVDDMPTDLSGRKMNSGISDFRNGGGSVNTPNPAGSKFTKNGNNQTKDGLNPEITKVLKEILDAIKNAGSKGSSPKIFSLAGPSIPKAKNSPNSLNRLNAKIKDKEGAGDDSEPDSKEYKSDVKRLMDSGMDKDEAKKYAKFKDQINKEKEEKAKDKKLSKGQRFMKSVLEAYNAEQAKVQPAASVVSAAGNITNLGDPMDEVKKLHDAQKKIVDLDRKQLLSMFDLNNDNEIDIDEVVKYFKDREMKGDPTQFTKSDALRGEKIMRTKIKAAKKMASKAQKEKSKTEY